MIINKNLTYHYWKFYTNSTRKITVKQRDIKRLTDLVLELNIWYLKTFQQTNIACLICKAFFAIERMLLGIFISLQLFSKVWNESRHCLIERRDDIHWDKEPNINCNIYLQFRKRSDLSMNYSLPLSIIVFTSCQSYFEYEYLLWVFRFAVHNFFYFSRVTLFLQSLLLTSQFYAVHFSIWLFLLLWSLQKKLNARNFKMQNTLSTKRYWIGEYLF